MPGNTATPGFLTLDQQAAHARRRLALAALAALLAFGLGVALVAALKAPLDSLAPTDANAGADEPATGDEDARPAPPTSAASAQPPASAGSAPPTSAPPTSVAASTPAASAQPPASAEPAHASGGGDWWEAARDRPCRIEFGDQPRLVMREGTLTRDETTTYGPFADNTIVLRINRELNPTITPHFFGLHPRTRQPALAYVTAVQEGRTEKGILPLKIGDSQLVLRPASDGAPPP